jgi:NAD-dependent SIR2 family protein deacetylase
MSSKNTSRKIITNDAQKLSVETELKIAKAAELILDSDAILFTSGAGMSVNSGLGTYRGSAAVVWPPLLQHPELDYTDIVSPDWFHKPQGNSSKHDTVNFAYAFWTDRYKEYTSTFPHRGYYIAKQWSELNHVKFAFSFTSNIDGHWMKSGWNEPSVFECHGSIHYMQCINNCCDRAWSTNDDLKLQVDPKTNCANDRLPVCPDCHELARPNVLMFNDWHFAGQNYNEKIGLYNQFKSDVATAKAKLLIIELGAGTAIPAVRNESECVFTDKRWTAHLVRINPLAEHSTIDETVKSKSKGQALEITLDALTALILIDKTIKNKLKQ